MKKLLLLFALLIINYSLLAQSDPKQRDSVANTAEFQYKVRSAALTAGYQLLQIQPTPMQQF